MLQNSGNSGRVTVLPARHRGFGRHRLACPSELLAGVGWRLDGPNKPYFPALAVCLGLAVFSSAALAQEQAHGLSNGLDISTPAPFYIWRTTTLGSYKGVDAYRDALDAANIKIGDAANEILGRPAFPYVTAKTKVELTVVSAAELGVESQTALADFYHRARQLGLTLCPAEVAPQLRLDYRDQPRGETLIIAMEPVKHLQWRADDLVARELGQRSRTLGWYRAIRLHGAPVSSFRVRHTKPRRGGMSVQCKAHTAQGGGMNSRTAGRG